MTARPFGLRDDPFVEGHDRRFLYPHRTYREAVDRLARAITQRAPFVMLTGPSGAGKTSALAAALASTPGVISVVVVAGPSLDIDDVRTRLLAALGEPHGATPVPDRAGVLAARLSERDSNAPPIVLAIDEAQDLTDAALEELRLLSNLESQGRKALSVVLSGQSGLDTLFERPEYGPLRQRIAARCRIEPMSARETEAFIHHRVSVCGGVGALFPRATCRAIHALTQGVAREVQLIAGESMAQAQVSAAREVEPAHVAAAAAALGFRSVVSAPPAESAPAEATVAAEPELAPPIAEPTAAPVADAEAAAEAVAPTPVAEPEPAPLALAETPAAEPAPAPVPQAAAPASPAHSDPVRHSATSDTPRPAPAPVTDAGSSAPAIVHTPAVQDWLARFRDPNGPPRIGSRVAVDDNTSELARGPEVGAVAAPENGEREAAPPLPRSRPRRGRVVGRGPLKPSRWARRPPPAGWIAAALLVVAIGSMAMLYRDGIVARVSAFGHAMTRPHASAPVAAEPASDVTPDAPTPSPVTVAARPALTTRSVTVTPLPATRATAPATPPRASVAPRSQTAATSAAPSVPAATSTDAAAPAARHYRVVVGSYLVGDRARSERDRIAAFTPFPCRVLKGHEDGAEVYRVLVGPFATRQEAEDAGEQLFESGTVAEARVVGWFGPRAPRN